MQNTKRPTHLLFPLLLVCYEVATYLSNDMYLPALPLIANDLQVSQQQVQLSLTTWFLGATSLQLILGPLSDRYGRRPILLSGGILFILSSCICALTSQIHILLIARFLQGATVCSMITAGYASIHEYYNQKQAIRLLALMSSITVLAPAFGPLIGNFILYFADWHTIFWLLTLWATLVIGLLFKWMPETNPPANRHPLNISTLGKNYFAILSNSHFLTPLLIFCLLFCGLILWISTGPFMVAHEFGSSSLLFGIAQIFIFGCYALVSHWIKFLIERINPALLIKRGIYLTCTGSMLGILCTKLWPNSLVSIIFVMVLYAAGAGLALAPLNRATIEASTEPMGTRMAIFSTSMSAFGSMGSLLASLFYNGTLLSFAIMLAVVTVMAWALQQSIAKKSLL